MNVICKDMFIPSTMESIILAEVCVSQVEKVIIIVNGKFWRANRSRIKGKFENNIFTRMREFGKTN